MFDFFVRFFLCLFLFLSFLLFKRNLGLSFFFLEFCCFLFCCANPFDTIRLFTDLFFPPSSFTSRLLSAFNLLLSGFSGSMGIAYFLAFLYLSRCRDTVRSAFGYWLTLCFLSGSTSASVYLCVLFYFCCLVSFWWALFYSVSLCVSSSGLIFCFVLFIWFIVHPADCLASVLYDTLSGCFFFSFFLCVRISFLPSVFCVGIFLSVFAFFFSFCSSFTIYVQHFCRSVFCISFLSL